MWIFFLFLTNIIHLLIDLITKLSIKLEVGETAQLLQKRSFRTKYLNYVQTNKKNPPLPHLWEVRDKRLTKMIIYCDPQAR